MAEYPINPKQNVFKKYRIVNYINSYVFAPPIDLTTNTEIGGVASTINTPALLATKLGIDVSRITNFTIVGSDIKCKITGSYAITSFSGDTSITYYKDDGIATDFNSFYNCSNLYLIDLPGVITCTSNYIGRDNGTHLSPYMNILLKNCTSLPNDGAFYESRANIIYIPNCLSLGSTAGYEQVFYRLLGSGRKIYVNPFLETCNGGSPDGDLTYAISQGAIVRYITNFTAPNPISDLSAGTIYNSVIQLNFIPPSSTNAIEYYECYANGVLKNTITASGQYITGLTASTSYNITVIAVDIFYNKSAVSNSLSESTTNNATDIATGLVSYYKLDGNSNDSFGNNNGTDTAISYVTGKVNNAASFNGSTSAIVKSSSSFDFFGTQNISIACWFKPTAMPLSNVDLISIQEVGTPGTIDKSLRLYANGSVSFYAYDGGAKSAQSAASLVTTGSWYHVVGTFDGTNLKIYLNGVLRATLACSGTYNFTSPQLTFGKSTSGVFNGLIDEAVIYNAAKIQTEIDFLYNSGSGTTL